MYIVKKEQGRASSVYLHNTATDAHLCLGKITDKLLNIVKENVTKFEFESLVADLNAPWDFLSVSDTFKQQLCDYAMPMKKRRSRKQKPDKTATTIDLKQLLLGTNA